MATKRMPNILYIGTATYDLEKPFINQTIRFVEKGCLVDSLKVTNEGDCPNFDVMKNKVEWADAIVISGGNTLFAIDRWVAIGLKDLLHEAFLRGVVATGGSAGAVCWFQGAHSDSGDPETFKNPMIQASKSVNNDDSNKDEASTAPTSEEDR